MVQARANGRFDVASADSRSTGDSAAGRFLARQRVTIVALRWDPAQQVEFVVDHSPKNSALFIVINITL